MGSEMCIRDRYNTDDSFAFVQVPITLDVILVVNLFDCFVELSHSFDLKVAVLAFDYFEDFFPFRVSVWVVGFPLVLRALVLALLRDGFELFLALFCSLFIQFS